VKKVLIIAEAGVNHNGDISIAKKLVDIASDAGADFVKFQTFNADKLVVENALKADYQKNTTDTSESQQKMLRRLELTEEMHYELIEHCRTREIRFLSTGFDTESINFLDSLGIEIFKIPSGEITNVPYLRHIGKLGRNVILSTGMSNMAEIKFAIEALEDAGTPREKVVVLHCTTAYPAPMTDVNLLALGSIREELGVAVGYSDHTLGIEISLAAVAQGATVIEKHFTVDRNLPGPDHQASLEPMELKSMVNGIRNIEKAFGDGVKEIKPSEIANRSVARKSIVARMSIKTGEIFSEDNLTTKRPGTGMSPIDWDNLIGKRSQHDYYVDEFINET
jgi:N,N'-diacetyllegionaminate synthase